MEVGDTHRVREHIRYGKKDIERAAGDLEEIGFI